MSIEAPSVTPKAVVEAESASLNDIHLSKVWSFKNMAGSLRADITGSTPVTDISHTFPSSLNASLAKEVAEERLAALGLSGCVTLVLADESELAARLKEERFSQLTDEQKESRRTVLGYQWTETPAWDQGERQGVERRLQRYER